MKKGALSRLQRFPSGQILRGGGEGGRGSGFFGSAEWSCDEAAALKGRTWSSSWVLR
jgi:hypothetical protein